MSNSPLQESPGRIAHVRAKGLPVDDAHPAASYFHSEYVHHDPLMPLSRGITSAALYTAAFAEAIAAFPDTTITVEHAMGQVDHTVVRWRSRGTNTGPFQGRPATGRVIEYWGLTMYRWENDLIVEGWTLFDIVGFRQRLGLEGLE